MKKNISHILFFLFLIIATFTSCSSRQQQEINITSHPIIPQAEKFYHQAITLMESSCDIDSTQKCISLLDSALIIDSLNPNYYGMKAKLLSEMGELDAALRIQTLALKKKAITGEYLFQLGLFQAAKNMHDEAHENFRKSRDLLRTTFKQYPDSLGAFILSEAANALYKKEDSLFMKDIDKIRKIFPKRLLEIEMVRRVSPHSLINQIRDIQVNKDYRIDFNIDSLVENTIKGKIK